MVWASRSKATRDPGGISLSPLAFWSGCYVLHPLLVLQPIWLSAFGLGFWVFGFTPSAALVVAGATFLVVYITDAGIQGQDKIW